MGSLLLGAEALESRTFLSGVPNGPFALTATGVAGGVQLSFIDNSDNEAGFVVSRAASAAGPYAPVGSVGAAAGTRSSVTFTDTAAPAGVTSYYQVYATGSGYQSSVAGPAGAAPSSGGGTGGGGTGGSGGSASNPGGPPNGPFNLVLQPGSGNSVQLAFIDNSDNETGFVVERSASLGGPYSAITTLAPSAAVRQTVTYADMTAVNGSTYYYRAYAVNGGYASGFAGPTAITLSGTSGGGGGGAGTGGTTNPGGPPNGPYALTAQLVGGSPATAKLTFVDNASNETGFVVERSTNVGGTYAKVGTATAVTGSGQTVTFVDGSGLASNTTYYYRAYAVNGGYQSGFAGPVSVSVSVGATPPVTPPPVERALNLLFFGNSFTFYNSLPTLVADIAAADGHPLPTVQMQAVANWTLTDHLNQLDGTGNAIINNSLAPGGKWDNVILQEFSTRPTTPGDPAGFRKDAVSLFQRVRAQSPQARAVLEETWARGADNPLYPATYASPAVMQDQLKTNYLLAAADINGLSAGAAEVALAGEAWRATNWDRTLYDGPDEYHPSPRGSLQAALAVYTSIYHDGTADIPAAKVAADLSRLGLTAADWLAVTQLADATDKAAIATA